MQERVGAFPGYLGANKGSGMRQIRFDSRIIRIDRIGSEVVGHRSAQIA